MGRKNTYRAKWEIFASFDDAIERARELNDSIENGMELDDTLEEDIEPLGKDMEKWIVSS